MIKKISIIGAGTMGAGIAQVSAQAGFETSLVDLNSEVLEKALNHIHKSFHKGVEKKKISQEEVDQALQRLKTSEDLKTCAAQSDLIIEAVPEKFDLKKKIFSDLGSIASESCVFATNTSSISVKELAQASGRPEKFLGMHFFNPPPILKLLEIVTHDVLNEDVLKEIRSIADKMDRKSIVVKDSPGFATSRLAVAMAMEAIRMLEEGVASAQDIDTAMEVGYRHPMGPLKLTDHIGLDVRLDITSYLYEKLGSETFKPPELLKKLVAQGHHGSKSGQGFYNWN